MQAGCKLHGQRAGRSNRSIHRPCERRGSAGPFVDWSAGSERHRRRRRGSSDARSSFYAAYGQMAPALLQRSSATTKNARVVSRQRAACAGEGVRRRHYLLDRSGSRRWVRSWQAESPWPCSPELGGASAVRARSGATRSPRVGTLKDNANRSGHQPVLQLRT